jgi:excisionase family DNA binding protein
MQKMLVTVDEAADILAIGRTQIYKLMALGTLESVKVSRSRRIPVEALQEYVWHLRETSEETCLAGEANKR